MKINNKIKVAAIFMIAGIISITIGVTSAFFNYTRTGGANTVRVGRVNFISEENGNITLTNVFPITSEEAQTDTTNAKSMTITVTGDTDYSEGVEYLISASDVNNTINGKTIPITLEVMVNGTGLGTLETDNYYTNRENYTTSKYKVEYTKLKEDGHVLVGYIAPNSTPGTASGIDGSITIKAYVDKSNILITDTLENGPIEINGYTNGTQNPNEKTIFTTEEWNSIAGNNALSFKVRVEANEGLWVEEPLTAFGTIRNGATLDTTIDFAKISPYGADLNGQGKQILKGTENDTYPIVYYRGNINNNNVVFADYCWQIVRTTDTGGIKMIYNGEPTITGSGNNISYNCGITRDIQDDIRTTTNLSESTGYYYADDYEIVSTTGNSATYRLKSATNPITQVSITNNNAATNIPTIVANYPYTCKQTTSTGTCTTLYKVDSHYSQTTAYVYQSTFQSVIENSLFNSNYQSVSDIGYMSNTRYEYSTSEWEVDALFASSATWVTDHYELTDASETTPDATHHYSCNATTANATCTNLRYVYYSTGTSKIYITLTNGELIEDAIYKMTGNGSSETKQKNSGYILNQNNSTLKGVIETWFGTNLTNVVDNTKTDYRPYIEDTIYCSDRSYKTVEGNTSYPIFQQSGWNPNGGLLDKSLFFGLFNRYVNNWYSTSNVPIMSCPNETDRFSVSSSIAHLNYPVGLLTGDEIIMAGAAGSDFSTNKAYYLYIGYYYLSMSPYSFENSSINFNSVVGTLGSLSSALVSYPSGVRPVISLKLGTEFVEGGTGTPTNPYVVKYE